MRRVGAAVFPEEPPGEPGGDAIPEIRRPIEAGTVFPDHLGAGTGDVDVEDAAARALPTVRMRLAGGVKDQRGWSAGPRLPSAGLLVLAFDDEVEERIVVSMKRDVEVRRVDGLGECEAGDLEAPPRLSVELAGREFGRHGNPRDVGRRRCRIVSRPAETPNGPAEAGRSARGKRTATDPAARWLLYSNFVGFRRTFGAEGKKSGRSGGWWSGHPLSRRDGLADRGASASGCNARRRGGPCGRRDNRGRCGSPRGSIRPPRRTAPASGGPGPGSGRFRRGTLVAGLGGRPMDLLRLAETSLQRQGSAPRKM